MAVLKRITYLVLSAILAFFVLWMIIVNDQSLELNLIFVQTTAVNAGLVILMALSLGFGIGFLWGSLRAHRAKIPQ